MFAFDDCLLLQFAVKLLLLAVYILLLPKCSLLFSEFCLLIADFYFLISECCLLFSFAVCFFFLPFVSALMFFFGVTLLCCLWTAGFYSLLLKFCA